MAAYHLQHETSTGRCAWCWKPLPTAEPHTVVSARRPPHLVLHFHGPCWDAYKTVSEIDLGPVGSSHDWPPERLETLRIAAGMSMRTFTAQLGVTESTYRRILAGDAGAFGPGVRHRVRQLAAVTRFDSKSPIDWGDPRAFFCLRRHLGLGVGAMARELGCSDQQVSVWDRKGVPRRSVRTWGRLARLAARRGFDAAMIVDDRLWTKDFLAAAIRRSGRSNHAWGAAAGFSAGAVQQWASGTRPIHREAAWGLSRAAVAFEIELPPVGRGSLRKGQWSEARQPLAPEHEQKRRDALYESKWTLETLRLLGTVPDRVLARRLGRTRNSVAIMRRTLGIPVVDARYWDGHEIPQVLPAEQIRRRWEAAKQGFKEGQRK